jgi:hypothetical protein
MLIDSSDLEFNKQIDTVRASPTVKVLRLRNAQQKSTRKQEMDMINRFAAFTTMLCAAVVAETSLF